LKEDHRRAFPQVNPGVVGLTGLEPAAPLLSANADYLFPIKANQSALLSRCQRLVWHRVPVLDRTRDQAHGQVEVRTLMAVTVRGFGFPHAAQVLQVTRKTRELHSQRWRTVVVRGHQPDLRKGQPRPAGRPYPRPLEDRNGLHYVRDVTFAEDASQIRSGTGPQVMAALRHLSSACCAGLGRSTLPPRCATTTVTTPTHGHPGNQARMNPPTRNNAGALCLAVTEASWLKSRYLFRCPVRLSGCW
jgi:hypothetical protein